VTKALSGFITGNLFISFIAGSIGLVTMLLLDIPYAFALAALLALFDLIPLVGAALATIAIALVALTQGMAATIIIVIVLLVYQIVEGHMIQPLVYSRAISLSPLLIILASVIGAELGGIIGVLLAIPAASVIQIVAQEFIGREELETSVASK
jgi:predicted PurR-regulated permease PerM